MQTLSPPDTSLPVPPPLPTEISIAFDILLSDFPEHVRGRGLSLEMLVEWDQVRSVLEAGTVDEATLEEVFGECSVSTPLGPRITKAGFGLVRTCPTCASN